MTSYYSLMWLDFHDGDTRLSVTVHDCVSNGRGTSPAWKNAAVHVQDAPGTHKWVIKAREIQKGQIKLLTFKTQIVLIIIYRHFIPRNKNPWSSGIWWARSRPVSGLFWAFGLGFTLLRRIIDFSDATSHSQKVSEKWDFRLQLTAQKALTGLSQFWRV